MLERPATIWNDKAKAHGGDMDYLTTIKGQAGLPRYFAAVFEVAKRLRRGRQAGARRGRLHLPVHAQALLVVQLLQRDVVAHHGQRLQALRAGLVEAAQQQGRGPRLRDVPAHRTAPYLRPRGGDRPAAPRPYRETAPSASWPQA